MAEYPGFTVWTDAYLGDTTHLTTLEHGAYLLLLFTMWRAGGSLPNDDKKLARYAKLSAGQWERIKETVMEFFTVDNGLVTQSRLTRELEFVRQRSERQSRNAKAKVLKDNDPRVATAQPRHSHSPAPTPTPTLTEDNSLRSLAAQAPSKRKKGTRLPAEWVLPKAWGQWALENVPGVTVEFVRAQANQFRDYWISKAGAGATKMDWEATWRNWMRTAATPRGSGGGHRQPKGLDLVDQQLAMEIANEHGVGGEESGGTEPFPRLSFVSKH